MQWSLERDWFLKALPYSDWHPLKLVAKKHCASPTCSGASSRFEEANSTITLTLMTCGKFHRKWGYRLHIQYNLPMIYNWILGAQTKPPGILPNSKREKKKAITIFFLLRIITWNVLSGVATLLSTQLWSTAAKDWLTTWWMLCTRSIGRTSKLKEYVIWKHKCSWSSGEFYESTCLM